MYLVLRFKVIVTEILEELVLHGGYEWISVTVFKVMKDKMFKRLFFALVALFFFVTPVYAGVTVLQALHFGSFIVKNNDAQYDITVHPGGVYSYSHAGFIEISPPQDGIYDIDGLPPNSVISSIVITQFSQLANSGENFQMVNFQETHSNSNSSGVATVTVGATARTSGSGFPYMDQTYTGTLQIQINF